MNQSESYIFDVLNRYSNTGVWKFFEVKNELGNTEPQAKNYGSGFVSYPDFEFYSDEKLMLLVEVKGYTGFFEQKSNTLAMKYRCYKNYKQVRVNEDVDVRLCFSIDFPQGIVIVFWESIDNIIKFPKYIQKHTFLEYDYKLKRMVKKTEDFIYWNSENFRTDEENLPLL